MFTPCAVRGKDEARTRRICAICNMARVLMQAITSKRCLPRKIQHYMRYHFILCAFAAAIDFDFRCHYAVFFFFFCHVCFATYAALPPPRVARRGALRVTLPSYARHDALFFAALITDDARCRQLDAARSIAASRHYRLCITSRR